MSKPLIFEHPLNERVRTFLRLEHLFKKVFHFLPQDDIWATRIAVEGLLDIVAITARADIKSELLKELDRNTATLNRIQRQPGVDPQTLGKVLDELEQAGSALHGIKGQIGQEVREDDFLKSVAQRNVIPGGSCSFDLPQYHHWLAQPLAVRHQRLEAWLEGLQPVNSGIGLVLSLARTSVAPRHVTASSGFFQESLNVKAPAQLVRVGLNGTQSLFPEISGHKNRFSIRFMSTEEIQRPVPCRDDVPFDLTCCVF